ncbi:hypothetical protein WDU94_012817 [Cyamophila willieti]
MVRICRCSVALLGYPGVFPRGRYPTPVLHERQGYLFNGQGVISRAGAPLYGRYSMGASRNFTER